MGRQSKSFEFKVKTRKELIDWIKVMKYYIEKNKKNDWKEVMPAIDKFWKFRLINEKDFIAKADTGDILLFTAAQIGAKLQRLLTRSRFGITNIT